MLPDLDLFNERSAQSSPVQQTVVLTHVHRPCVHTCQEANYGHQQEVEMIPLMMQKDYSAKGWLGLILGTRLWYAVHCCLSIAVILLCLSLIEIYFVSVLASVCSLFSLYIMHYAGMPCGTRRRTMTLLSNVGWTVWCVRSVIGERCKYLRQCHRWRHREQLRQRRRRLRLHHRRLRRQLWLRHRLFRQLYRRLILVMEHWHRRETRAMHRVCHSTS